MVACNVTVYHMRKRDGRVRPRDLRFAAVLGAPLPSAVARPRYPGRFRLRGFGIVSPCFGAKSIAREVPLGLG